MDAWADITHWAQMFMLWLGRESLEISLLVGVIAAVLFLLGRYMSPRWRYVLWIVLLVKVLVPWLPASRFSLYRLLPSWNMGGAWQGYWGLLGLWLVGALGFIIFIYREHYRLWRGICKERALTSQPVLDLLETCRERLEVTTLVGINLTDYIQTPTLMGFLRPRLLLPKSMAQSLSKRQLCHIFLHELAHLKRHDIGVNWLMTVGQVVYWFNPFVGIGFYWMRSEREMACDQVALQQLETKPPQEYGQTIICLIEHLSYMRRLPALAGLAQDRYQLKRRLKCILGSNSQSVWSELLPAMVFLLLAGTAWTRVPTPQPIVEQGGGA